MSRFTLMLRQWWKVLILAGGLTAITLTLARLPAGGAGRIPAEAPLTRITAGFAWPEFRGTVRETDPTMLAQWDQTLAAAARAAGRAGPHFPYWRFILQHRNGNRTELLVSRELVVYAPAEGSFLLHDDLPALLKPLTEKLHDDFFGEPLTYPEVDPLWPFDARAQVRDLETGLTFQVDRYGGNLHVDAQPVTPIDTQIMKHIFSGEWSWRRRAVVVEIAGRRIAASMNGMPHGWGTLMDNDFRGHFCIHFTGSRTHGSGSKDNGHRLMVLKSAGDLARYLDQAPPEEVVPLALTAIDQADATSLRYATDRPEPAAPMEKLMADLFAKVQFIEFHNVERVEADDDRQDAQDDARAEVAADITVYYNPPAPDLGYRTVLRLPLTRTAPAEGWKVPLPALRGILDLDKEGNKTARGGGTWPATGPAPAAGPRCSSPE